MRSFFPCCCLLLAAGSFISSLAASDLPADSYAISTPITGLIVSGSGTRVTPIFGIAGANRLGTAVDFAPKARRILVPPGNGYVVEVLDEWAGVLRAEALLQPDSAPEQVKPVTGMRSCVDASAFNPSGGSLATYCAAEKSIQVISGFPSAASVVRAIRTDQLPSTELRLLALSDDAATVIAVMATGEAYLLGSQAAPVRLTGLSDVTAIAAAPGARRWIVCDGSSQEVWEYTQADGAVNGRRLLSADDGVGRVRAAAMTADRANAFVLTKSGGIWRIALESGAAAELSLPAAGNSLLPLADPDTFLFSQAEGKPAWLLHGQTDPVRFDVIPASN